MVMFKKSLLFEAAYIALFIFEIGESFTNIIMYSHLLCLMRLERILGVILGLADNLGIVSQMPRLSRTTKIF